VVRVRVDLVAKPYSTRNTNKGSRREARSYLLYKPLLLRRIRLPTVRTVCEHEHAELPSRSISNCTNWKRSYGTVRYGTDPSRKSFSSPSQDHEHSSRQYITALCTTPIAVPGKRVILILTKMIRYEDNDKAYEYEYYEHPSRIVEKKNLQKFSTSTGTASFTTIHPISSRRVAKHKYQYWRAPDRAFLILVPLQAQCNSRNKGER